MLPLCQLRLDGQDQLSSTLGNLSPAVGLVCFAGAFSRLQDHMNTVAIDQAAECAGYDQVNLRSWDARRSDPGDHLT